MKDKIDFIVKKIAHQLEDYDTLSEQQAATDRTVWSKMTLSHGLPGICMLFGKLADCDSKESEHWQAMGRQYMGYVVEEINHKGIADMSLYSGLSGVGMAAACLSRGFNDYTKLLTVINKAVSEWVLAVAGGINFQKGTHSIVYDVIAGMTGIISYLSLFQKDIVCEKGIASGLDMLIAMTKEIQIQGVNVPGWYIPSENQFTPAESKYYPKGNFNTGMSHGIAGPLTLLSQMAMKDVIRPGQMEAIRRMTDFLVHYKIKYHGRDIWNGQIDFEEVKDGKPKTEKVFHRDAWCYGAPGICYALICAAMACEDRALLQFGIENLRLAAADMEGVYSPTICHGYMGIYQIMDAVEGMLLSSYFTKEKEQIKNKILGYYDERTLYGFQDFEYDGITKQIQAYDTCGFLEGAAGVALGLYSVENSQNNIWRKTLLLV